MAIASLTRPATTSAGSSGGSSARRAWRRLGLPRQIAATEYDEWPRGRIVYEKPARRFIIYADPRLQAPDIMAAVKTAFGLDHLEAIVRSDLHYR